MPIFNNCSSVWLLLSIKSLKKVENLPEKALPFLYYDYGISYENLLFKVDRFVMSVKRLETLFIEIFKTLP